MESWPMSARSGRGSSAPGPYRCAYTLTVSARTKAIDKKGKNLVFVRPELIAEIEYRGWTDDGKLRHSSFKGLRDPTDG